MKTDRPIRAVLFDLDGTLLDTAPDLAAALNDVLLEQGRQPHSFEAIRPHVSHGGSALVQFGFGMTPEHEDFDRLRERFLEIYRNNIARHTRPFAGMLEVLDALEQRGLRWGVVTNKPAWLTLPLMEALALHSRAGSIVSGDTLPQRKPHPEPLFHACREIGLDASECLYVGDAERDIAAGRAAGMTTLVALFGYLGEQDDPAQWLADAMIQDPREILDFLGLGDAA